MEAMAKLNGTGLENGYGIVEVPEGSGLEAAVATLKGKMNGNGKDDVVMSKSNVVVGTPEIKVNVANMPQINVGIGTGFAATLGVPDMPQVKGTVVERMSRDVVNDAIAAGVFGARSVRDKELEELLDARWYQKHVTGAWIPGSTKENQITADLSMVTDQQSNDALNMFSLFIGGEVVPCISLQPAVYNRHLEAGYRICLQVMHTFKGARFYPLTYKLDEEENVYSVQVHGLTHPVKEGDKNKLGADGKPVFEFNDGINIQVSAQLHCVGHKLAQVFVDWAKGKGLEY